MGTVSIVADIESWRSSVQTGSSSSVNKELSASGSFSAHWCYRIRGFRLQHLMFSLSNDLPDLSSASVLGDTRLPEIYDVPEGKPQPIGHAYVGKATDEDGELHYVQATVHTGAQLFDELYARHTYGGVMPTSVSFLLLGEGESWEECIDVGADGFLPIMHVVFNLATTVPTLKLGTQPEPS